MIGRRAVVVVALLATLAPAGRAQTVRIASTSTAACIGCVLTLDSIATLGGGQREGEYFATPAFNAVVHNGRALVSATVPVHMFELSGRFVGMLGRRGQGPGEFASWLTEMSIGPQRSLHVFSNQQVVIFDSALKFVRKTTLARGSRRTTVLGDGHYAGLARTPPSVGQQAPTAASYRRTFAEPLVHIFAADGKLLRSIGTGLTFADDIIAPGAAGTVWTAKRAPYVLSQWAQDGRLLRTIERTTPFFGRSPYIGPWPYIEGAGPRAELTRAYQDSLGLLWVAAKIVKPGAQRTPANDPRGCCESLIEVLDPETGRLLASAGFSRHVQILTEGYVAGVDTGPNGEPLLVLYRARFSRPRR